MTVNEAIERLECMRLFMEINDKQNESKFLEDDYIANKMAIQALKEIQQYRAIGTVEDLKSMKENGAFSGVELAQLAAMQMRLREYQKIGTIEEFKALKEKSVAKKPIRNDLCTCPSCGTYNEVIGKRRNTVAFDTVYCWHCGQAIEIKRD